MYEPFFGMERRPFSATPDPGCFFSSSELQTVLDELTVCVERGQGIGILTASAGIGKTLLCQRLAADLRARDESGSQFECVYLSNSNFPTRRSLLQAILFEMGDEYSRRDEPELRIDLRSRLLSLRPQREALVLIVDEAHLFADELLEELRTLSDLADEGSSLVRIVLSGQHDLEERLTDRSFDALNQRISKHVFAEPLTISESVEYIGHRLEWSGSDIESVFSDEAISIITRASGGVPRCLNQLSDHSLLLAFASDQKPVTEDTVREALEDLKQLPLHWNDVSDGTEVVGYVEDEGEESSETFDVESEDPAIDADLEAALSQLADSSSGESYDDESTESASENETADVADEAGIVESLRAAFEIAPPETQPANATTLADGFEFDFSDSSDEESLAPGANVTSPAEPEGAAESEESSSSASDPEDVDETLIQVLPSTSQETMLEVRPNGGPNDSGDDNADDDGAGMSFQITSDGFELDDFGPPEEIDTPAAEASPADHDQADDTPADSGVIEFSFSAEASTEDADESDSKSTIAAVEELDSEVASIEVEESVVDEGAESAEQESSPAEHTVSAADITLALFGQDSVLPEHRSDTVMTEPVDETELEEPATAAPPAAKDAADDTDADVTPSEEVSAVEAEDAERESFQDEEPEVMSEVVNNDTGYEEELVFDPYAALQEPDGAGIVWDVASSSRLVETVEASESPEDVDASTEAVIEGSVEQVEMSDSVEATEQALDVAAVEQTDEPPANEASTAEADLEDDKVEKSAAEETVEAVDQSWQSGGEERQSESANTDDEFVAEPFEHQPAEPFEHQPAEQSHEDDSVWQSEHDIVQPVNERPLQPDRLVDAVLPLLDELDEDLESITRPGMTGRSVLDIEAELIQTIEHGSDELEDQIGATMLDICLDTQSALQDSAAAIRNAEAAELESFNDFDDAADELPGQPFDIVQPEPPRQDESASYNLDLRFIEPSVAPREAATPTSPAQDEQVNKPFGRLFSDLRRRKA
jgi:type II secretory pathway predicted ATPase ExeA